MKKYCRYLCPCIMPHAPQREMLTAASRASCGHLFPAPATVVGSKATTKTDVAGKFTIDANEGDTVVVTLSGYRTAKVVVKDGTVNATLNYAEDCTVNEDNTVTFQVSAPTQNQFRFAEFLPASERHIRRGIAR